jgi:hypothetical protein
VRYREQAAQVMLEAPPPELLMFTDMSQVGWRGPGMDAYPDRAAWLAARHDWETRHGMTVAEWAEATWDELRRRARSLEEFNEALALTMFEEDDWQDPRMVTA